MLRFGHVGLPLPQMSTCQPHVHILPSPAALIPLHSPSGVLSCLEQHSPWTVMSESAGKTRRLTKRRGMRTSADGIYSSGNACRNSDLLHIPEYFCISQSRVGTWSPAEPSSGILFHQLRKSSQALAQKWEPHGITRWPSMAKSREDKCELLSCIQGGGSLGP